MNIKKTAIPDDYHDYIYRATYLLLLKVAPYVPRKITPNQITIAAFISAMLGTALLYFVQSPSAYLYWVVFNFIWYILDAMDGMHARLSGQTSEYGAFLDHALDNIYFLFMLTVFAVKFHLLSLLYVYILILRVTAAVMVFTVQCHTRRLYLSRFSGGLELILLNIVMILSYCFPTINPVYITHNPFLLYWIQLLDLQQGMFMKLILLVVYAAGIPINFILQFRFVHKTLSAVP